jgi:hypothetical protein
MIKTYDYSMKFWWWRLHSVSWNEMFDQINANTFVFPPSKIWVVVVVVVVVMLGYGVVRVVVE